MSPLLELGFIALGLYVFGWLSTKLGLSSIVGYIVLGLALGPHGVVTLYRVTDITTMLGELGLVMLLFYLGLEFSLPRLLEAWQATAVAGVIDLLNFGVGWVVGMLLGLGFVAALFLGAIVYVSSSGVIAKLLGEQNLIAYPEAERTLGVLVFEDLAMVVILGGLGLLTSGAGVANLVGVAVFLVLYLLLLRFGRGAIARLLGREGESLILVALALLVLFSVGASLLGFPEAVAAFLLGMLVGESNIKETLEPVIRPWYDVAAAAFFLEFSLHVDVSHALRQLPDALLLVVVTVLANLVTGYFSGRATGLSKRASIGHGLMLLPRGEFSLVIVGMAGGVMLLPDSVRNALTGMTSLYVVLMVIVGSMVFRYYDAINGILAAPLKSARERRVEEARRRELDSVTLD
ncbi:MAG TPA: cation:proton antiporter [Trueperaceae bacterium]